MTHPHFFLAPPRVAAPVACPARCPVSLWVRCGPRARARARALPVKRQTTKSKGSHRDSGLSHMHIPHIFDISQDLSAPRDVCRPSLRPTPGRLDMQLSSELSRHQASRAPAGTRARRHRHLCNGHGFGRDDRQELWPVATQRVVGACIAASDDAPLRHVRLANGAAHGDALERLLPRLGARAAHAVAAEAQPAELVDGEALRAPADEGDLGGEIGRYGEI